mgnify:FL=1|tara:strand:- start:24 stop:623 length:600 start_codon:yes stop_codon:yes gene_type:complete
MRYYKHNIGDFFADTYYLSNERLAVYTKLVWEYYLQEQPITVDDYEEKAYELKTDEPTLTYILNKYFYLDEDVDHEIWRHKRIDTELIKMNSANQQRSDSMKSHHQHSGNKDTKINGFDKFWESYPNKKDKQKAIKAWAKYQPDIVDILKALVIQKNSEEWKKDNGRYIPLPTTWLNGARWEDEVSSKTSTNSTYANIK